MAAIKEPLDKAVLANTVANIGAIQAKTASASWSGIHPSYKAVPNIGAL